VKGFRCLLSIVLVRFDGIRELMRLACYCIGYAAVCECNLLRGETLRQRL